MRYFQLNKNDILVLYHHSYLMQTTCSLNYMIQQYRNRSLCGMQDELNHIMSHYFTYSFLLIIWKDATRTITPSWLLLLLQLSLCMCARLNRNYLHGFRRGIVFLLLKRGYMPKLHTVHHKMHSLSHL